MIWKTGNPSCDGEYVVVTKDIVQTLHYTVQGGWNTLWVRDELLNLHAMDYTGKRMVWADFREFLEEAFNGKA